VRVYMCVYVCVCVFTLMLTALLGIDRDHSPHRTSSHLFLCPLLVCLFFRLPYPCSPSFHDFYSLLTLPKLRLSSALLPLLRSHPVAYNCFASIPRTPLLTPLTSSALFLLPRLDLWPDAVGVASTATIVSHYKRRGDYRVHAAAVDATGAGATYTHVMVKIVTSTSALISALTSAFTSSLSALTSALLSPLFLLLLLLPLLRQLLP
jgi:hypothetical protein